MLKVVVVNIDNIRKNWNKIELNAEFQHLVNSVLHLVIIHQLFIEVFESAPKPSVSKNKKIEWNIQHFVFFFERPVYWVTEF